MASFRDTFPLSDRGGSRRSSQLGPRIKLADVQRDRGAAADGNTWDSTRAYTACTDSRWYFPQGHDDARVARRACKQFSRHPEDNLNAKLIIREAENGKKNWGRWHMTEMAPDGTEARLDVKREYRKHLEVYTDPGLFQVHTTSPQFC